MLKKNLNLTMRSSGLCWLWITVIVFILDRGSKHFAQAFLSEYSPLAIFPGLNFTLSYNKGAAFSFLDQGSGWQVWFFGLIASMVSIGIIIWLKRLSWRDYWVCIALSMVVGGALGNLWDRIYFGHVVDFIQVYAGHFYWPTFNIADSTICVGAFMLFLHAFKK